MSDESKMGKVRHSICHLMSMAVQELYPQVGLGVGPAIENGFYQDYDLPEAITPELLPKLEKRMREMIKQDIAFVQHNVDFAEAYKLYKHDPYKTGFIDDLKARGEKQVSFYKSGWFENLCAGPHVGSTKEINPESFKLTKIAGAYWRGDEKNKMLQRIYGLAFETKEELDGYLKMQEEAEKRDHRKIGKELDLFSVDEYVGAGLVLWHPKLSVVREEIELYWRREHRKRGYQYIYTPNIGKSNLWETSGHLDFFKAGMYPEMKMESKDENEKASYYVKPMSCPFHIRIYKSRPRSYRDLPIRWCELGSVYRYEESGVLRGMLRVRGFTQDDAHIMCRQDQFVDEINGILDFALDINKVLGFDKLNVYLSVRDPKKKDEYVGEEKVWELAEKTLIELLEKRNLSYQKDIGGAKFYGPAIDLKAVDCMGREWQGTTIQLDMNLPSRFGMAYIGEDGKEHEPIMIHRTLLGSMERFVGTLIENCAGAFPLWLSPVQVKILPVGESHIEYCHKLGSEFRALDVRVEVDDSNESVGKKIRNAEKEKIPYMLVCGDKEMASGNLAVRVRGQKDMVEYAKDEFIKLLKDKIGSRAQDLV